MAPAYEYAYDRQSPNASGADGLIKLTQSYFSFNIRRAVNLNTGEPSCLRGPEPLLQAADWMFDRTYYDHFTRIASLMVRIEWE